MNPLPGFAGSHNWAAPLSPHSSTLPVGSRCRWTATTGVANDAPHLPRTAAELEPPGAKVAAMVRGWMTLYWQVPVPLQGGPQRLNVWPAAAVAVSVSWVYAG